MSFSSKTTPSKVKLEDVTNYPDLTQHNNWMAKLLTPEIYQAIKDKKTKSGFSLDGVIQTGIDNPGHPYIFTVGKCRALNDPCFPDPFWMGLSRWV